MFKDHNDTRRKITADLINSSSPEDKTILDLGSKRGASTDMIKCRKRIRIDMSKDVRPEIISNLSGNIPLKDNSVDICIAGDIIEHLYHSKQFISEIARILKGDGILIISVPNIVSLKYRMKFLFGGIPSHAAKGDCTYPEPWKAGHIRDYSFKELRDLLKKHNFTVLEEKTHGISYRYKVIVPHYLIPKTFGDSVIIKAMVKK